jgi:hypothetical protein
VTPVDVLSSMQTDDTQFCGVFLKDDGILFNFIVKLNIVV